MENTKKRVDENKNKTVVNWERKIVGNKLEEIECENEAIIINNRKEIELFEVREEIKVDDYSMEK